MKPCRVKVKFIQGGKQSCITVENLRQEQRDEQAIDYSTTRLKTVKVGREKAVYAHQQVYSPVFYNLVLLTIKLIEQSLDYH